MKRGFNKIWLIAGIVITIVMAAVVVSLVSKVEQLDQTKTVDNYLLTYEVGKLDDADGRAMTTAEREAFEEDGGLYKGYMHLKSFVNADGLKITLTEKAKVKYKVFFYDENYVLVVDTGETYLDEDFTAADLLTASSAYSGVKYAKIEVVPTADQNGTIETTEIAKYGKMLTIKYNKFEE